MDVCMHLSLHALIYTHLHTYTYTHTHTHYIKWGARGCIASGLRDVTSHDLPPRVDVCYLCACRWVGTCRCACVGPGQAPK